MVLFTWYTEVVNGFFNAGNDIRYNGIICVCVYIYIYIYI